MTKEEFFEKLLRLTWDNGYEYHKDNDYHEFDCVVHDPITGDFLVRFRELELGQDFFNNIERFLIDHEFIRVLCELRWKPKSFKEARIKEEWVMGNLAHSQDRLAYLQKTFSCLVEDSE